MSGNDLCLLFCVLVILLSEKLLPSKDYKYSIVPNTSLYQNKYFIINKVIVPSDKLL